MIVYVLLRVCICWVWLSWLEVMSGSWLSVVWFCFGFSERLMVFLIFYIECGFRLDVGMCLWLRLMSSLVCSIGCGMLSGCGMWCRFFVDCWWLSRVLLVFWFVWILMMWCNLLCLVMKCLSWCRDGWFCDVLSRGLCVGGWDVWWDWWFVLCGLYWYGD